MTIVDGWHSNHHAQVKKSSMTGHFSLGSIFPSDEFAQLMIDFFHGRRHFLFVGNLTKEKGRGEREIERIYMTDHNDEVEKGQEVVIVVASVG